MSIRALDSFNRYSSPSDLAYTTLDLINWTTPDFTKLSIGSPSPSGTAQYITVDAGGSLTGVFPSSLDTWIVGCGINPSSGAAFNVSLVDTTQLISGSPVVQSNLVFDTGGETIAFYDGTGTLKKTLPGAFATDSWNYLNLTMTVDPSTGSFMLVMNNGKAYEFLDNLNTHGGTNPTWNGILFSVTYGSLSIADFVVQDTTAPSAGFISTDTLLGPAYVEPAYPDAPGPSNTWTPSISGGPNYAMVNNPHGPGANSVSVTQTSAGAYLDLYDFGPIPNQTKYLAALQITGLYSNAGSTTASLGHSFLENGLSNTETFNIEGSVTDLYFGTMVETNPATNNNWTSSDVTSTSFGPYIGANSAVGTLVPGETLVNASGTLLPGQSIGGTIGPVQGLIFTGSITGTLQAWPLGAVGGSPEILIASFNEATHLGNIGINLNLQMYQPDGFSRPGGPYPSVNIPVITQVGGYLDTKDTSQSVVETYAPGVSVTGTLMGSAIANAFQYDPSGAITGILGDVIVNGNTYSQIGIAQGSDLNSAFGIWNISVDIGLLTYEIMIQAASSPPPQVVSCNQFLIEALTFTSSYGGSGGAGSLTYPIFPTLVGQAFPYIRRPIFSNITNTGASQAEVRIGFNPYPLWEWEIEFSYLPDELANGTTDSDYKTLVGFFLLVRGNLLPFLYQDPDDNYTGFGDVIGVGDGSTKSFLITRSYGLGDYYGAEPIGYWDDTSATNFYVGGEQVGSEDWSIDQSTPLQQMVNFTTAPALGAQITWEGGYYFFCRMGEEKQDFTKTMEKLWETNKLVIHSLRQS